ncbi:hypothetical protein C2869_07690 [Saccharobesus litoralis]|uniref:Uncharacterized protein n=1 Tax=Saccharobesus litoralis TaxID=2172099 RepID=A0A2S0VQ25_9ALTE|nr:hypothetical protein [Saccharobesus litoralis]AWB66321.1 hypothetical protein C2869_07690 [Saccharobesus litoralis]
MKNNLFIYSSLSAALVLAGCSADLEPTDIQVEEKLEPNDVLFRSGKGTFSRGTRLEVKGDANTLSQVSYYYLDEGSDSTKGQNADSLAQTMTYPVTGLSVDSKTAISIKSVSEISGTCFDPAVLSYFDSYTSCQNEGQYTNAADEVISVVADSTDVSGQNLFQYELRTHIPLNETKEIGTAQALTQEDGLLDNGTVIVPTFNLSDQDWNKLYRAVMSVGGLDYEFMVRTGSRNPVVDITEGFLERDVNNWRPGRTVTRDFQGQVFNTRAPVVIEKDSKDYSVKYQLGLDGDLIEYTQPFYVRAGKNVFLHITTPEGSFEQSYTTKVTIGEVTPALDEHGVLIEGDDTTTDNTHVDTLVINNHAQDYVPGPSTDIHFPPLRSATANDSVTLRATTYINMDQAEFSEQADIAVTAIVLQQTNAAGEPIGGVDPVTIPADQLVYMPEKSKTVSVSGRDIELKAYDWQTQMDVSGTASNYYFTVVGKSDLAGIKPSVSEPTFIHIEKNATLSHYPQSSANIYFNQLTDITVDTRNAANPTILMSDNSTLAGKGKAIIWKAPMDLSASASCAASTTEVVHGVQVNHVKPEIGGVFIGHWTWRLGYITDDELSGTLTGMDPRLSVAWRAPRRPAHMAFSHTGDVLYMASQSIWNFNVDFQHFVGTQEFKFAVDGEGKFSFNRSNGGQYVNNNNRGPFRGALAKETNSNEDAGGEVNNGFSLDAYTIEKTDGDGNSYLQDWILSLDGVDNGTGDDANRGNTGEVYLRKVAVPAAMKDIYQVDAENNHTIISLVDENNMPITLERANAIAVDDKRGFAYISVPEQGGDLDADVIWKVDLQDIEDPLVTTWQATKLASNEGLDKESPMLMGRISSFAMEGGLDMILATDKEQRAVWAIDPISGDRVYLLKSSNVEPVNTCN